MGKPSQSFFLPTLSNEPMRQVYGVKVGPHALISIEHKTDNAVVDWLAAPNVSGQIRSVHKLTTPVSNPQ